MRSSILGFLVIAVLCSATPARAECTYGDMLAIFESIEVIAGVHKQRGIDTHMARQLYAPIGGPCQYRLWAGPPLGSPDAPPVQTFTEGQYFLGGSVLLFENYADWGLTREQTADDLALFDEHLYLMRTDSQWGYDLAELVGHEQPLRTSAFRNSVSADGALTLSRHRALIDQLPAGRYVSLYTLSYPGNPVLQAMHPDNPFWVWAFSAFEGTSVVHLDIVKP